MAETEEMSNMTAPVNVAANAPFSVDRLTLHKTNVAPLFSCNRCGMGRTETRWLEERRGICKRIVECHACGAKGIVTFRLDDDGSKWVILSISDM